MLKKGNRMAVIIGLFLVVAFAVILLRGFDKVAGRGPKQISDGINDANQSEMRIDCPMCAEKILSKAKICPFCKSTVAKN